MNKETLKKHHFWFLFGAVPLLTLIAVLVMNSGVGGAIEKKKGEIKAATQALDGKQNPKPVALIKKIEEQNTDLAGRQGKLWQANWERQKPEFTWPNSPLLKAVEKMDLKFGAPIPSADGEHEEFRRANVYLGEYENANKTGIVDKVAPTQFNNGWQNVLRHIAGAQWGQRKLNSEILWLALEDIWVERAVLNAVKSVNDQIAAFEPAPPDAAGGIKADNKLRRKFVSRNWEVELWTEPAGNGQTRMAGKITNTTDRLQLFGIGNVMTLRVWLDDVKKKPNAPYFDFRVATEYLPGKGATKELKDEKGVVTGTVPANVLEVTPTGEHIIPSQTTIVEIGKVAQIFDARTVPVKRIDRVALGYPDSRNANAVLKKTESMQKTDEANAAAVPATTSGAPEGMSAAGGRGSGAAPPGATSGSPDGGTSAGSTVAGGQREGGGTVESVLDANRARYLEVSENVRRMPVGIVLVVDQAYLQDVLLAYANSPLRFQITQVHWSRFRGTLNGLGTTGPGGSSGETPGFITSGGGLFAGGFGSAAEGAMPRPAGPTTSAGGPGPRPSGPPGTSAGGPPGTSAGSVMPGGYGGGMMTTVSEAQLTSGLVEVCIYGVISLYEKYEEKKDPPAGTTTDAGKVDAKDAGKVDAKDAAKDATTPKDVTPPKADAPKTDVPKADSPKSDAPKPDAPKAPAPPTDPKGKPGG